MGHQGEMEADEGDRSRKHSKGFPNEVQADLQRVTAHLEHKGLQLGSGVKGLRSLLV